MRPRIGISSGSHLLHDAGALERAHAARGERQIDGTAALGRDLARIGTALVERHPQPAPREQQREQRAGEPGADDVDGALGVHAHGACCSACVRASAKRQTSSKRL